MPELSEAKWNAWEDPECEICKDHVIDTGLHVCRNDACFAVKQAAQEEEEAKDPELWASYKR